MTSVIHRVSVYRLGMILASLLFAFSLCAQTQTTTNPLAAPADAVSALKTIFGSAVPAGSPTQFVGLGAGYKNGATSGWLEGGTAISPGSYAVIATDSQSGNTSVRAGVEQLIYAQPSGAFFVTLKVDAGAATGASSVGGSYGTGASLAIRLGKASNKYLALSSEVAKSDVSVYLANPNGKAGLRTLASGMTFRLGLLGKTK